RISLAGATQWTANGVAAALAPGVEKEAAIAADGAGGAFLAWQEKRNGNYDLYAQHWNSAGNALWNPAIRVCNAAGAQQKPAIVADGAGNVIVAWCDGRAGGGGYFG